MGINKTTVGLGLCSLFAASAWALPTGAPPFATGAPGDGLCIDCHGGSANTGPGQVQVALLNATNWTPGQPVTLRVTLSDPTARRWGFELTARTASDPMNNAGSFTITDTANTQLLTETGVQFVTHRAVGTRAGTSESSTWEVQWTPPADAGIGNVTFYVAGNAANNDGTASGDKIYASSTTVSPGGSTPTTTARALPQLAFGSQAGSGAWYTAVYFHNTTGGAVSVPVKFFGADGAPLNIPSIGGTTTTVNLASRGEAIVEVPNTGSLTQGWIQADVPDGVIGYGIFRQSVDGQNDQEGTVPFSSVSATTNTIVFDETTFDTAVAVLNPTSTDTTVSITVRDEQGSLIGTSSLPLGAMKREAFLLRDRAELATMRGKRGSADFTVSSGAVSVLGLRFKGLSFTSILPSTPGSSPAATKALPQLAFGGGWYTAMYVHNTTDSGVSVPVSFFGADGAPLAIPSIGGSTTTVNLAAKGAAIIEAPNTGALTQGWIQVQAPDGVVGYGVFRQSVQGQNDQEGTVPFSSIASTTNTIVFDETSFDTAVAALNPTSSDATLTITVRDDSGNQIGVVTRPLAAKRRDAFLLRELAGLDGMRGKRGSADFTVSSGAVSVLGLRFKGLSFTSILPAER